MSRYNLPGHIFKRQQSARAKNASKSPEHLCFSCKITLFEYRSGQFRPIPARALRFNFPKVIYIHFLLHLWANLLSNISAKVFLFYSMTVVERAA